MSWRRAGALFNRRVGTCIGHLHLGGGVWRRVVCEGPRRRVRRYLGIASAINRRRQRFDLRQCPRSPPSVIECFGGQQLLGGSLQRSRIGRSQRSRECLEIQSTQSVHETVPALLSRRGSWHGSKTGGSHRAVRGSSSRNPPPESLACRRWLERLAGARPPWRKVRRSTLEIRPVGARSSRAAGSRSRCRRICCCRCSSGQLASTSARLTSCSASTTRADAISAPGWKIASAGTPPWRTRSRSASDVVGMEASCCRSQSLPAPRECSAAASGSRGPGDIDRPDDLRRAGANSSSCRAARSAVCCGVSPRSPEDPCRGPTGEAAAGPALQPTAMPVDGCADPPSPRRVAVTNPHVADGIHPTSNAMPSGVGPMTCPAAPNVEPSPQKITISVAQVATAAQTPATRPLEIVAEGLGQCGICHRRNCRRSMAISLEQR